MKQIRADSNEIVLSTDDETYCRIVFCKALNFMGIPDPAVGDSFRCQVKIRYRHPGQYAAVEKTGDDEVKVTFEEPVRSATPGQSAVFYDEKDCLLGGGIISEAVFS